MQMNLRAYYIIIFVGYPIIHLYVLLRFRMIQVFQ